MSAFGTKRTSQRCQSISAFGGKADMTRTCAKGQPARRRAKCVFKDQSPRRGREQHLREVVPAVADPWPLARPGECAAFRWRNNMTILKSLIVATALLAGGSSHIL